MKKKEILFLIVLCMVFSIMLYSCGGGDGERHVQCFLPGHMFPDSMTESECRAAGGTFFDPGAGARNISGNWNFYLSADGIKSELVNLTLDQSGTDFNGVYTCDQIETNINGSVTDSNVSFMTIDKSFSFTGVVSGNTMSGTWVAINGTSSGTWRADREEESYPQ
jgi:hypothetical protein